MTEDSKLSYYQKFREKEWFIIVQNKQQGPYSIKDLRAHPYFTPDTLVWKNGFSQWKKARSVPELKEAFRDQEKKSPAKEEIHRNDAGYGQRQMILTLQHDPYPFLLWILIFLIILFYVIYQLDGFS